MPRDSSRELTIVVDPVLARYSTWYELFPRSAAPEPGRHGTFRTASRGCRAIAAMGFDVLYLPPIHPIGRIQRKGPNNTLDGRTGRSRQPVGHRRGRRRPPGDPSGTRHRGRTSGRWSQAAREHGIEIALDIAFQCAPDHPYVNEHPEWFQWRPDGTVQYAENPPKKYQDIYPFDFENPDWQGLFEELKDVFLHWIARA